MPGVVELVRKLDPTRLIDVDSGGGANAFGLGDVNDIHTYSATLAGVQPTAHQYALIGEFGGVGATVAGKEWQRGGCHNYQQLATAHDEATTYLGFATQLLARVGHLSGAVLTQATDIELECDGFKNYDRTAKFGGPDTEAIKKANQALIRAATAVL